MSTASVTTQAATNGIRALASLAVPLDTEEDVDTHLASLGKKTKEKVCKATEQVAFLA